MPSSQTAEEFVREAVIGDGWLHPEASNYTFVVHLELSGSEGYGIYKPKAGEAPLRDFPSGTLYLRECAAYELSKALGWGLIPPTVERDGEAGQGSLQLFVPHDLDSNYFSFRDHYPEESIRLALFDLIANNADRKGGHCFVGRDDRVWAVDNGLTFNQDHKLRTVIWDFAGCDVPQALIDDLMILREGLGRAESEVAGMLSRLLAPPELEELNRRVEALVIDPVLPTPQSRRDLPWPWL